MHRLPALSSLPTVVLPLVWLVAGVAAQTGSPAAPLERYGLGTASSANGEPVLWASAVAHLGDPSFQLRHEQGAPFGLALCLLGTAPLAAGLNLLQVNVDPATGLLLSPTLLDAVGRGGVPLPLPASPSLNGIDLFGQGFVFDAGSPSPFGLTSSAGLRFRTRLPGALLVGTDVLNNPNDPLLHIDLASGVLTAVVAPLNAQYQTAFSRDGTRAFVLDRINVRIGVFDTTVSPPVFLTAVSLQQPLNGITVQPTVLRVAPSGDVLMVGVAGTGQPSYSIEVFDANPSSPTFLASRGTVPQQSHWLSDLWFHPTGHRAYALATVQTGGSTPRLTEIDTDPASSTYLQNLGSMVPMRSQGGGPTYGRLGAISPDGRHAYLGLWGVTAQPSEIAIVELATMTQVDCDPTTPGIVDPLLSLTVPGGLGMDLRGRELFVGERAGAASRLLGVIAEPLDPAFRNQRSVGLAEAPQWVHVSPAGDLVYVVGVATILEIETGALGITRSWTFPGATLERPDLR